MVGRRNHLRRSGGDKRLGRFTLAANVRPAQRARQQPRLYLRQPGRRTSRSISDSSCFRSIPTGLSWLWGVRTSICPTILPSTARTLYPAVSESLNWQTKNNLLEMQLGLQAVWGWDRFQLSSEIKGGFVRQDLFATRHRFRPRAVGFQPFDESHYAHGPRGHFRGVAHAALPRQFQSMVAGRLPVLLPSWVCARSSPTRRLRFGRLHWHGRTIAGVGLDVVSGAAQLTTSDALESPRGGLLSAALSLTLRPVGVTL